MGKQFQSFIRTSRPYVLKGAGITLFALVMALPEIIAKRLPLLFVLERATVGLAVLLPLAAVFMWWSERKR